MYFEKIIFRRTQLPPKEEVRYELFSYTQSLINGENCPKITLFKEESYRFITSAPAA
jgi:hypothetical protein